MGEGRKSEKKKSGTGRRISFYFLFISFFSFCLLVAARLCAKKVISYSSGPWSLSSTLAALALCIITCDGFDNFERTEPPPLGGNIARGSPLPTPVDFDGSWPSGIGVLGLSGRNFLVAGGSWVRGVAGRGDSEISIDSSGVTPPSSVAVLLLLLVGNSEVATGAD